MPSVPMPHAKKLVRLPAVRDETGLSTSAIYREMAAGRFPKSVVLGPNARAWCLDEIKEWITARITARDAGTDAWARATNPNIGRGRRVGQQVA